jgi:tRNA pseudouridine32 synthase/23S rRNA pseudouridine746 synthase
MTPKILFQSNHLLIIDKPAGLAVHRGPRARNSVEDFFPLWRRGHDGPWLAHRLDADTAGCLVIARRKSALITLQSAFREGRVRKTYWAIVGSVPRQDHGIIDLPLLKVSTPEGWKIAPDQKGQPARTVWRCIAAGAGCAWLELTPQTGRTHQLRAHCAAIGHPILGDGIYGNTKSPLLLLARSIILPLDPHVTATASVPEHMQDALRRLGFNPDQQDAR